MRCLAVLFCFVIALVGSARAEESAETTTTTAPPAAAAPIPQETVVLGTPPADLEGRWLVMMWMELAQGNIANAANFWEIARHDGKLVVTARFVRLPTEIQAAMDKASGEHVIWKPSPADVERVRAEWDQLPTFDSHMAQVKHEISARDGFPEEVKQEARTKDAIWVNRQRYDADPSGAPMIRQVQVYAALASTEDGGYSGNFDGLSLAAAPFPIPLKFTGTFQLYPIDHREPAPRGFLARLLDALAGCGRRPK